MYKTDASHNKHSNLEIFLPRRIKNTFRFISIISISLIISACKNADTTVLPDEANDRVAITNNLYTLNQRVTYTSEDIGLGNATPPASRLPSAAKIAPDISFRLISKITPPTVKGEKVQATSVTLTKTNTAVISYNMRGALHLGALDWINGYSDNNPHLTSGIVFSDSDINAVNSDGEYVYAAAATDSVDFQFPAVLERFRIKYHSTTLNGNVRAPLSSFAATSVLPVGNVVYATSGNQGSIYAFDAMHLNPLGEFPLHDARWAAFDEINNRLVVVQGTPGMISIFEEGVFPGGSMNLLNSFTFPGANVAESKSTVEIAGGKAFIAAGPEGVQIMCLDDGSIIGSVPRPDPVALGLDPSVVVTNAVSVDEDLMFISNGEAGIYVASGSENFDDNNCATQQITILGKLRFGDLQSANHVAYKSRRLYVAAGLGGVKIVKVKVKN